MSPSVTNIGILAHVDAGKTSLTERILFDAGLLRKLGAVDAGTTQTDTMDLERQRGITIRSAVVSFTLGERVINLVDTPGHPDFIAEVERALRVLDAVILVVSAVEGIQPQTRRLSRAIAKLGLPCLIFVNKIDRRGAREDELVEEIRRDLQRRVVVMSACHDAGTPVASSTPYELSDERIVSVLAEEDDDLLAAWIANTVSPQAARDSLRRQIALADVTPILFGSAMNGAGVPQLFDVLERDVPAPLPATEALSAEVFKIERNARNERLAYCRIWGGELRVRELVDIATSDHRMLEPEKLTRLELFRDGTSYQTPDAHPGDIVRVLGLSRAKIGDWIGEMLPHRAASFDPPVFESEIRPDDEGRRFDLNRALDTLVDEDPLIDVRRDDRASATYVHLYGEVQEQVITETLRSRFGVQATLGASTVLCVERLTGIGRAAEIFGETEPPFYATVGFIVQPKRSETPSWTYTPGKAKQGFFDAAELGGRQTMREGIYGWPIIDADVEVTDLIYLVASMTVDYRHLAELVMADAIRDAGTVVCEPVLDITIRFHAGKVSAVATSLVHLGGRIRGTGAIGEMSMVIGTIPAASLGTFTRGLPSLTEGKVDVETSFHDYLPVTGEPPRRPRTDLNPFNRREYLARIAGQY